MEMVEKCNLNEKAIKKANLKLHTGFLGVVSKIDRLTQSQKLQFLEMVENSSHYINWG